MTLVRLCLALLLSLLLSWPALAQPLLLVDAVTGEVPGGQPLAYYHGGYHGIA